MHALVSIPPSNLPQFKPSPLLIPYTLHSHPPTRFCLLHLTDLMVTHLLVSYRSSSRPFLSPTPALPALLCRTNSAVINSTLPALVIPPHFYLLNHPPGPHHLTPASFFLFSTPSSFSLYPTPLLSPAPILTIPQPSYLLQLTPFDTALWLHLTSVTFLIIHVTDSLHVPNTAECTAQRSKL